MTAGDPRSSSYPPDDTALRIVTVVACHPPRGLATFNGQEMQRESDFDEFFRATYTRVATAAARVTGTRESGEDAAAEAFARCLVRWPSLREADHKDAWVMRVALNLAIDAVRSATRRPTLGPSPLDSEEGAVLDRLALSPQLLELPSRQRQAIVLRHLGGLTDAEVAAAMGLSLNSVKTHLKRGLARLRLDPEGLA